MKTEKEILELLADIEHERWADWQKHVNNTIRTKSSYELEAYMERWDKQINTKYSDLSEEDKQKDRDQVMRYWDIIYPKHKRIIFDLNEQELEELAELAIGKPKESFTCKIKKSYINADIKHVCFKCDIEERHYNDYNIITFKFSIDEKLNFYLMEDFSLRSIQNQVKLRDTLNDMLYKENHSK